MTQRAGHSYHTDDNYDFGNSTGWGAWVWGVVAALAALAVIVWFATSGGPSTSLSVNGPQEPGAATGTLEPAAPADTAPAVQPAQPAQ